MSKTEAQHGAVAQRLSVLAVILETPRRRSAKLLQYVLQALGWKVQVHPHSLWVALCDFDVCC